MNKVIFDIVIVNSGKFGREVYSWIQHCIAGGESWRVKGFLDERLTMLQGKAYDVKILGDVESYRPERNDRFVIAIGDPLLKKKYAEMLIKRGSQFANLIHPTALLGENVRLGIGVILAPYSALTCDIAIGNFVTISSFSGVGHDCVVGDYCQFSGHCSVNGNVVIEECVFLGAQSTILPGSRIGSGAYVGAGSVVLKRVKPGTKVFGNPAVVIDA